MGELNEVSVLKFIGIRLATGTLSLLFLLFFVLAISFIFIYSEKIVEQVFYILLAFIGLLTLFFVYLFGALIDKYTRG